jgi:hypothetical protein
MPIEDFEGETFVAFIDISGFKNLMKRAEAERALNNFYQYGYDILNANNRQNGCIKVDGIFISDCGILFVRDNSNNLRDCLMTLLRLIRDINIRMLQHDYILTTSIAYGSFRYQSRIELIGIDKNLLYGNAYLDAYLDNDREKPKIRPGQCRIVKTNLPDEIKNMIKYSSYQGNDGDNIFPMIRSVRSDRNHYYFYWMRQQPDEIDEFEQKYRDANNLKYTGYVNVLKGKRRFFDS